MNKNLTCSQVSALVNFYVEGKLNSTLSEYVNLHIKNCPHCKKKIEDLKKILVKYSKNFELTQEYISKEFVDNLSAYVDNELNENENIRMKKMTISNPNARKELESMYTFQKLLHLAYQKTKNDYKMDYSKAIISRVNNINDYTTTYFSKIMILFAIIIFAIFAGFIFLYF
ncbi:zf-HC2 domain-containing protein [bacterium]|nr:zf-HC2 domain-containing protein [bacterium]